MLNNIQVKLLFVPNHETIIKNNIKTVCIFLNDFSLHIIYFLFEIHVTVISISATMYVTWVGNSQEGYIMQQ